MADVAVLLRIMGVEEIFIDQKQKKQTITYEYFMKGKVSYSRGEQAVCIK